MSYFPPRDPPLPLAQFTTAVATEKVPFRPAPIRRMIGKYAAGLKARPSAEQLRDWMNNESPIPAEYHPAIRDTIAKMDGWDYMTFRQNSGSSIRGLVHLIHETQSFSDRIVHYVDTFSDVGDLRPRWDRGYAGFAFPLRFWAPLPAGGED